MKVRKGLKIVSIVAAVAVLCGSLGGCGGESASSSNGRTQVSIGNWPSKEGTDKENMEAKRRGLRRLILNLKLFRITGALT